MILRHARREGFYMKKLLSLLILLVFVMALTACGKAPAAEKPAPEITQAPAEEAVEEAAEEITYTVYLPNDNADGFDALRVSTEEITWEAVLAELKSRNVLPETVSVNSFKLEDALITIDFNRAFADVLCSMGTTGELMIVGSVVNTFLAAYSANAVCFTVDGGILESGHTIYDFPLSFISY